MLLAFQLSEAKGGTDESLFVPDFAEPLVIPAFGEVASSGAAALGAVGLDNQPPEEMVAIIISMGFQRNVAIQALKATVSSWVIGSTGVLFHVLCACACSDAFETCTKIQLVDDEPGTVLATRGIPEFSGAGKVLCVFHRNGKVWKAVRKTYLLLIPVEK